VSLVDLQAFNEPVSRALAAGIPVVSNADVPTNARLAYIGQDLFASGAGDGEEDSRGLPSGSSVAIFIATPGSLNIQPRADGAASAIKASGKEHYRQAGRGPVRIKAPSSLRLTPSTLVTRTSRGCTPLTPGAPPVWVPS